MKLRDRYDERLPTDDPMTKRPSRPIAVAVVVLLAGCQLADGDREKGTAARGTGTSQLDTGAAFVCPPCAPHDTLVFDEDGRCPVCGMRLIERPDSSRVGHAHLHRGSGNFLLHGGTGHRDKWITVFYHVPADFSPRSPILVVLPGSGRNANEYRDAWIEASERYGVLVLSPRYPEADYGFGWYHMGGLMTDLNIAESVEFSERSNEAWLDEEALRYHVNRDAETWIFNDLDRIFEKVAAAVGSDRDGYDLFGHSAGGQILHRLVLFRPASKAGRIVAANAGFYTMPDPGAALPFGVADAPVNEHDLRRSFGERLVLLLGEEDDEESEGGTFLRSPSADRQGPGRLQRGRHFFRSARSRAQEVNAPFRWRLEVVPDVGHDHERMSEAAAEYLYGHSAPGPQHRDARAATEEQRYAP